MYTLRWGSFTQQPNRASSPKASNEREREPSKKSSRVSKKKNTRHKGRCKKKRSEKNEAKMNNDDDDDGLAEEVAIMGCYTQRIICNSFHLVLCSLFSCSSSSSASSSSFWHILVCWLVHLFLFSRFFFICVQLLLVKWAFCARCSC